MQNNVLFSIIIPTYNRAHLIKKAVSSVLSQTYSNFEIIVVDDGSTDSTEEVISLIRDPRLNYFKKKNEERSVARNFGIRKAKGEYITFLDSDDILYENHFQEAINLLSAYKDAEFFHLAYEVKNTNEKFLWKITHKGNVNLNLLKGNILSCMGVFAKREILSDNMFREDNHLTGSEDWELWVRLASRYKIYYSNTITSALIQHTSRSVINQKADYLIARISLAYSYIFQDKYVVEKFSKYKNLIQASLWIYLALHLVLLGKKSLGFKHLVKSAIKYPPIIFTKKFLVVIYKLIFI